MTTTDLAVSHWLHEVCPFPLVARLSRPPFVNAPLFFVYLKSAAQALQTTDLTFILDNFTRAKKYFTRAKKYFARDKKNISPEPRNILREPKNILPEPKNTLREPGL